MSKFLMPISHNIGATDRIQLANEVFEKTPFSLGIVQSSLPKSFVQKEENAGLISTMRGLFGFAPSFSFFEGEAKAVSALFEKPRLIIGIAVQNLPSDGWWLKLLLDKSTTPKIFGRIVVRMVKNHSLDIFTLGVLDNDLLWENTIIVVETGQPVSKQWLKEKLTNAGLPLKSVIESIATHSGKCLHLVDISKSLKENTPILSLNADMSEINLRVVKKVGGYN